MADGDRWSPEAIAAANDVLRDRLAGRAPEPDVPDTDEPPEFTYDPDAMLTGAAFLLGGLFGGALVVPFLEHVADPDRPVPFGQDMAWVCVCSTETAAVAEAMALHDLREATWGEGIEAAHRGAVYVTPPVAEWTLVVGTPLFRSAERPADTVRSLLLRLSDRFGEAHYFSNHAGVGLSVWARAREGRFVRGFGWLAARNECLWDEGSATEEEEAIGFRFQAGRPSVDLGEGGEPIPLPDDSVLQLASVWSIDPSTLDDEFKEPGSGLLGSVTPSARPPWRSPRSGGEARPRTSP